MEWNGEKGVLSYYDKEKQENVIMDDGFTFLLLDQLSTVKGWHDASDSRIFANEVRDTKSETLVVKAFKHNGVLAEGFYASIRDRVGSIGGAFVANLYVAFKSGNELHIGSVQFKGAALSVWSDFKKEHRAELYSKAIVMKGVTEGKKGRIVFKTPLFHLKDITPETNQAAVELDKKLQDYLAGYFKKPKTEQGREHIENPDPNPSPDENPFNTEDDGSDVPF